MSRASGSTGHAACTADPDRTVARLRRVVVAMLAGVLAVALPALLLGRPAVDPGTSRALLLSLAATGAGMLPAYIGIRARLTAALQRALEADPPAEDPTARMLPRIAVLALLGAALAEGFGLLGAVVFPLTAANPALVAVGIAVALLLAQIPTRARVANFVERVSGRSWP